MFTKDIRMNENKKDNFDCRGNQITKKHDWTPAKYCVLEIIAPTCKRL